MRASGTKLIAIFHRDDRRSGWVGFCTWRLGHTGPYVLRAANEAEMRARLKNLDETVIFYLRGEAHGFDPPPTLPGAIPDSVLKDGIEWKDTTKEDDDDQ